MSGVAKDGVMEWRELDVSIVMDSLVAIAFVMLNFFLLWIVGDKTTGSFSIWRCLQHDESPRGIH